MTEVDRIFEEYRAAHRSGGDADPQAWLERLRGPEREELAGRIDGYLTALPREPWDEVEFRARVDPRLVETVERSLDGASGLWPALLPRLRERAQLRRGELVERLAAALGLGGREAKVARYYHEMEQGLLPPRGVSQRVLDALAQIVDESAEALRRAGEALGAGPEEREAEGAVFARAVPAPEASAVVADNLDAGGAEDWDEVDELFRGG